MASVEDGDFFLADILDYGNFDHVTCTESRRKELKLGVFVCFLFTTLVIILSAGY